MLSHESAAWLWGLLASCPNRAEVTIPARGHIRATVSIHHSTILDAVDGTVKDGVPLTAVPRTLLDLAARPRPKLAERALERSDRLGLLDTAAVDSLLARSGRHRGRSRLRAALAIYRDPAFTRSRPERVFLDLVLRAGLPRPAMNTFVAGHEIDAYWETERFAVELDGYATHRTRMAFENDPIRVENLKLAGIDVVRITARRLEREPDQVVQRVAALLKRRGHELKQIAR
jgi:hypothetical protein